MILSDVIYTVREDTGKHYNILMIGELMVDKYDGVVDHILEFSNGFEEMEKQWKYRVSQYEEGIEIEYLSNDDSDDGELTKKQSINISMCCAALFFKSISDYFDKGYFG